MSNRIYLNLLAQLDKLRRHNRQGSFKTRQRYYESMQRFCQFLAREFHLEKLSNIAPKHLFAYVRYMQEKGLAPSTIKTDLAAIRFWHDKLSNPRYRLPDNDALGLARRSFGKVDRTWKVEEFNRFIGVCWKYGREDYVAIACLARYAGLRIHECLRIDTATAERAIQEMQITVKGKGGRWRTVDINDAIRIELQKMLAWTARGQKLFVPDDTQTHTEIKRFQQFIIQHREEFQAEGRTYPLHAHGLRHTYAREHYLRYINSGMSDAEAMREVSHLLGHNRPEVTNIYLAGIEDTVTDHDD